VLQLQPPDLAKKIDSQISVPDTKQVTKQVGRGKADGKVGGAAGGRALGWR